MGRKQYEFWITEEGLAMAAGWARNGLSDEQIASNIGISRKTFYQWMKKYKPFQAAVRKNKEMADLAIENALYKSALGYCIEEEIKERVWDPETHSYKLQQVKVHQKYIPPSQQAQMFWLKNRRPDLWMEKQHISHEVDDSLGKTILPEKRLEPEYNDSLETTT